MTGVSDSRACAAPDAALCLDDPHRDVGASGRTLFFFQGERFFCWDVARETMREGYPRPVREAWPGLRESSPGRRLRGALHVRAWGPRIHFFFEGDGHATVWNLAAGACETVRPAVQALLPGRLAAGDFTPVGAQLADGREVVYGFSGHEYTRWAPGPGASATEEAGFPRRIDADWKDGLVLAPRAGVYVDWPGRSTAHSNRKLYFFMGDLYLRWDVPTHTRNYRLDTVSGWKGWPAPATAGA